MRDESSETPSSLTEVEQLAIDKKIAFSSPTLFFDYNNSGI